MTLLQRIDTPAGRYYQTPDGLFPSVTTILGSIPSPELDAWRDSMGHEAADAYTTKAAAKGTMLHDFCERYLKDENPVLSLVEKYRYQDIIKHLDQIEPLFIEHQMWSKKLRVAGTADCIGKYQGKLSLIDFKSTSRMKYDGDFDSYWLQTAAYVVMAYERLGIVIEDLVIIMQDLTAGECNVYRQKARDWIPKFKEIRDAYQDQQSLLPG